MYLVLVSDKDLNRGCVVGYSNSNIGDETYKGFYIENIKNVSDLMTTYKNCKVYKLDSLTEVARIDVTMDEITKDMLHG